MPAPLFHYIITQEFCLITIDSVFELKVSVYTKKLTEEYPDFFKVIDTNFASFADVLIIYEDKHIKYSSISSFHLYFQLCILNSVRV